MLPRGTLLTNHLTGREMNKQHFIIMPIAVVLPTQIKMEQQGIYIMYMYLRQFYIVSATKNFKFMTGDKPNFIIKNILNL